MLLLSSADFFFKISFFKKLFQEHSGVFDPDQAQYSVGPYLGPNCLQRLSADGKLPLAKKESTVILPIHFCPNNVFCLTH